MKRENEETERIIRNAFALFCKEKKMDPEKCRGCRYFYADRKVFKDCYDAYKFEVMEM